jgi:hypothetical protein
VLAKRLNSRRGRVLSPGDIDPVVAVADSLAFTIDQMARIDEAYRLAFPEQTRTQELVRLGQSAHNVARN